MLDSLVNDFVDLKKHWCKITVVILVIVLLATIATAAFGPSTRGFAFLLAIPLGILGLYLANRRTLALTKQSETDSKRLLNETFAKSIELLGNKKSSVRQGAIYALGKIAEDNTKEREIIGNTLCAFIRDKQSIMEKERLEDRIRLLKDTLDLYRSNDKNNTEYEKAQSEVSNIEDILLKFEVLNIDIEAAIKVIVNISNILPRNNNQKYDLSNIYLLFADFSNANLSGFNLSDSHFYKCIFEKVDFSNSNLVSSNFKGSNLKNAKFNQETEIQKADLSQVENLSKTEIDKIKKEHKEDIKLP